MRLDNWEERFYAMVEANRNRPFVWGDFDCMTFAALSVEALTGKDVLSDLMGAYDDANTAYRVLNELGGVNTAIEDRVSHLAERKYHTYAKTGDLIIVEQEALKARVGVMINGRVCGPSELALSSHEINGGIAWCF